MAKIKVLAGDIKDVEWLFDKTAGKMRLGFKSIKLKKDLASVEVLTEENQKKLAGTFGWGAAGLVLLGPLGAIGGMLLGGRKKEAAFVATLKDDRSFMAITDNKTYQQLMAYAMKNSR